MLILNIADKLRANSAFQRCRMLYKKTCNYSSVKKKGNLKVLVSHKI